MNLIVGLLITIFIWLAFSVQAELAVANDASKGCCSTSDCGVNIKDKIFYWLTLVVAIFFTLAVSFSVFENVTSPGTKLPGGIPVPQILDNI